MAFHLLTVNRSGDLEYHLELPSVLAAHAIRLEFHAQLEETRHSCLRAPVKPANGCK
jgi:hypothetical protein